MPQLYAKGLVAALYLNSLKGTERYNTRDSRALDRALKLYNKSYHDNVDEAQMREAIDAAGVLIMHAAKVDFLPSVANRKELLGEMMQEERLEE